MSEPRHPSLVPTSMFPHAARTAALAAITACLAVLTPAPCQAAGLDIEAAYTDDDNVTRGQWDRDVVSDRFLTVTVGAGYLKLTGSHSRLVLRGFLRAERSQDHEGLNNTGAGGSATFQYRASSEFAEPTWALFLKASVAEYDSTLRDSNFYSLGGSVLKPLTDRITVLAQLAANRRDSDSRVFDNSDTSLLLNLDYLLTGRATLYASANRLDGDIVSTVSWATAGSSYYLVNAAKDIETDDVFANWVAYRLTARTLAQTVGINYMVNERNSLDFSARWIDSEADYGIEYKRRQVTAAWLARF